MRILEPYLVHIGNCGATNSCPIDERCICGLRQTYHKLTTAHTKMQSVTRCVQRAAQYGEHTLSDVNIKRAMDLAGEL